MEQQTDISAWLGALEQATTTYQRDHVTRLPYRPPSFRVSWRSVYSAQTGTLNPLYFAESAGGKRPQADTGGGKIWGRGPNN